MALSNYAFMLVLIIALNHVLFTTAVDKFEEWFPEYRHALEDILKDNCSAPHAFYLAGKKNDSTIDRDAGGDSTNQLVQPVIECILNFTSELMKSNMGSAGVVLGLTPTMLAILGSSTEETSLLFVIAKRPIFAIILAAGSPAMFPLRTFEHSDPLKLLKDREGVKRVPGFLTRNYNSIYFVYIVQYLIALAAVANIGHLSFIIGTQSILTFSPETTYHFFLWASLGICAHLFSAYALYLRTRVKYIRPSRSRYYWLFVPFRKIEALEIETVEETYAFLFLSWISAGGVACHVIYGTLLFSGVLFISARDSCWVIARYMGSVVACRIVLTYELAALREVVKNIKAENQGKESQSQSLLKGDTSVEQVELGDIRATPEVSPRSFV
jgi:hypothetical protein